MKVTRVIKSKSSEFEYVKILKVTFTREIPVRVEYFDKIGSVTGKYPWLQPQAIRNYVSNQPTPTYKGCTFEWVQVNGSDITYDDMYV